MGLSRDEKSKHGGTSHNVTNRRYHKKDRKLSSSDEDQREKHLKEIQALKEEIQERQEALEKRVEEKLAFREEMQE